MARQDGRCYGRLFQVSGGVGAGGAVGRPEESGRQGLDPQCGFGRLGSCRHLSLRKAGRGGRPFDGVSKTDATARSCLQLVQWISEELKRTAGIDMAARKAHKERVLARGAEHLSQPPLNFELPNEVGKGQKGRKAQR